MTAKCSYAQKTMDDHFVQVKLDNTQLNSIPSEVLETSFLTVYTMFADDQTDKK